MDIHASVEDKLAEGKLDLVPMIDCIMLLLLFFILTTRFTPEEKRIDLLLPDQGQLAAAVPPPLDDQPLSIALYPAGMQRGEQPSAYLQHLHEQLAAGALQTACLRIGARPPLTIDGTRLASRDRAQASAELARIHAYVGEALASVERPGDRARQVPLTIRCFSGLPWKFALAALDAVRGFEQRHGPHAQERPTVESGRPIAFAPPQIRSSSSRELGVELAGIVNAR